MALGYDSRRVGLYTISPLREERNVYSYAMNYAS